MSFETKGKNGQFINKKIFIDDTELSSEEVEEAILNKCVITNDCVSIVAITEKNNPKYFDRIFKDLEKNKQN